MVKKASVDRIFFRGVEHKPGDPYPDWFRKQATQVFEGLAARIDPIKLHNQNGSDVSLIRKENQLSNNRVLEILNETKKAVQMDVIDQSLSNGFVHAVEINGEIHIVRIEKYVPAESVINLLKIKL